MTTITTSIDLTDQYLIRVTSKSFATNEVTEHETIVHGASVVAAIRTAAQPYRDAPGVTVLGVEVLAQLT